MTSWLKPPLDEIERAEAVQHPADARRLLEEQGQTRLIGLLEEAGAL